MAYLGDSQHSAEQKSRQNIVMISIVTQPNFNLIQKLKKNPENVRNRIKFGEIEMKNQKERETLTKSYLEDALRAANRKGRRVGSSGLSSTSSLSLGLATATATPLSFFICSFSLLWFRRSASAFTLFEFCLPLRLVSTKKKSPYTFQIQNLTGSTFRAQF